MRSWRKGIRRWLKPIGFKHTGSNPVGRIGARDGTGIQSGLKFRCQEDIRVRIPSGADTPVWWNLVYTLVLETSASA